MTQRKKKGLGLIISGAVSIVAGVCLLSFTATPEWLAVVVSVTMAVCGALGIYFLAPDVTA
jgi:uncharacterized membrane protein HdeD (DUF308 family)